MPWASWANFTLGLWLIAAPFALTYTEAHGALLEDVLLGIVIASFALARAVSTETSGLAYMSWIVAVAGLWVLIAPFALGYTATTAALYNDVLVGLAVLVLGTWEAVSPPRGGTPHMAARE